MNFQFRIH